MTNLKDTETQVTAVDSRTRTGGECGDWNGYQIHDRKIYSVKLSYTTVIPCLKVNIFSMTQALKKISQVM